MSDDRDFSRMATNPTSAASVNAFNDLASEIDAAFSTSFTAPVTNTNTVTITHAQIKHVTRIVLTEGAPATTGTITVFVNNSNLPLGRFTVINETANSATFYLVGGSSPSGSDLIAAGVGTAGGDSAALIDVLDDDVVSVGGGAGGGGGSGIPDDNSVSTVKIQDNAVTLAKIAHGTQGGLPFYAAAGAPTELAAGTAGQVLRTGGAGANPSWLTLSNAIAPLRTGVPLTPSGSAVLAAWVIADNRTLPADLVGSAFHALTAPSGGAAAFDVQKNGASIGTLSWADAASTPTITFAADVSFVSGDRLTVVAPATLNGIDGILLNFMPLGGAVGMRRFYLSKNAVQSIAHNTETDITWQVESGGQSEDVGDWFDSGTSTTDVVVPAGVTLVLFVATIVFATNGTGIRRAFLRNVTAATNYGGGLSPAYASAATPVNVVSGPHKVSSGDTFRLTARQDSGGPLDLNSGDSVFFSGFALA